MSRANKQSGQRGEGKNRPPFTETYGKYIITATLGVMAFAVLLQVYLTVFPDRATVVPIQDADAMHRVFYSGHPHFVLCSNDTSDRKMLSAFEETIPVLRSVGMESVIVDCHTPLPSGLSVTERFKLNPSWRPQWFMVANGKRPQQLAPSLMYGKRSDVSALAEGYTTNKVMTVTNLQDLQKCIKDRTGGCLLSYTPRDKSQVVAELQSAALQHRTVKLGVLDSRALAMHARHDTPFEALLNAAIRNAREAGSVAGVKGELLILLKRAAKDLGAWTPDSAVFTIGYTSAPGQISAKDVEAVVSNSKAAAAIISPAASGSGGGDVSAPSIDALLDRDDALLEANSAVINKGDMQVVRAGTKRAKATPPPSTSHQQKQQQQQQGGGGGGGSVGAEEEVTTPAQRKARRDRLKAEYGTGSGENTAAQQAQQQQEREKALSPEERLTREKERERVRREEMAREEAESAYVAHLAEEASHHGDEGERGGARTGEGEDEEDSEWMFLEDLEDELMDF